MKATDKIEFGDFQTPYRLALEVCKRLAAMGLKPDVVIEPTCGVGAFVEGAARTFTEARVLGFEINDAYLSELRGRIAGGDIASRVEVQKADFFSADWKSIVGPYKAGGLLILGNLPWVTSAVLGAIGSENLPAKSNFLNHKGFDAITGKANFDISEWMLLTLIKLLAGRRYDVAMLIKTATARKVISFIENSSIGVSHVSIVNIDAKREFNASVDASLLVIQFSGETASCSLEYNVFESLVAEDSVRVGHRHGLMISDLRSFDAHSGMFGSSPQKWRSGVKHDASSVMELTMVGDGLINGFGESVVIEDDYLYPLFKGSDIGSNRGWRGKFVIITQERTGQDTAHIKSNAPATWAYLERHSASLSARRSSIYAKGPSFSIFGVGDYAFRPWRIAICGLYKKLSFRLIGPVNGKAAMFDDTVYYVSFNTEGEARSAFEAITRDEVSSLFRAMIFWDEKRPIKSSILNCVDWSRAGSTEKFATTLFV